MRLPAILLLALATALAGCGREVTDDESGPTDELPLGEVQQDLTQQNWGSALNCKPIPNVPALADPYIVVSLDGLTLHLRDHASNYDRVFPIGPGAIDPANGLSKTPTSTGTTGATFYTSSDTREVSDAGWGYYYPCKIWWQDSATGETRPVFAGLPFIRLVGPPTAAYALHGPVDNFTAPNGGTLRRGFVSHGCVRLRAEDIVEVYARIHKHPRTPVRIQKEIERDALGRAVDVPDKWIGQECTQNSDCNYAGGICQPNAYGRSFCTMKCTASCPDKVGYVTTRCVSDGHGGGMCAESSDPVNNSCRNQDGRVARTTPLFGRAGSANVCLPGSHGDFGSSCKVSSECKSGMLCQPSGLASGPGFCTMPCTTTCPGNNTICTNLGGQKRCVPTCWSQDVCEEGLACEPGVARMAGGTAEACTPG